MHWARRQFSFAECAPYVDRLEKLVLAHPRQSAEFMMVSITSSKPESAYYFVGVPTQDLLRAFDGFDPIEEKALPREVNTVLVADQTKESFTSRFTVNVDRPARKKIDPST